MNQTIFQKQVMQRYNLPAIYQLNDSYGSDAYFAQSNMMIRLLSRCFEDENSFRSSNFRDISVDILLDYIRRSHRLYLDKLLQEMEQTICLLHDAYEYGHPLLKLLNNFLLKYKLGLIEHIREEDEKLLPYIQFLENSIQGNFSAYQYLLKRRKFNIRTFVENHDENDEVLDQLRTKVLDYKPPHTNRFLYGILLQQLEFFSLDLKIHGLIEEKVLIPRAIEVEKRLEKAFDKISLLN